MKDNFLSADSSHHLQAGCPVGLGEGVVCQHLRVKDEDRETERKKQ